MSARLVIFMFIIVFLLLSMCEIRPSRGEEYEQYGPYAAQFIRVLDGDTMEMRLFIFPNIEAVYPIRILFIDTAELRTRNECEKRYALAAKAFAEQWFGQGDGFFYIDNVLPDSFGSRMLGSITNQEGESYAVAILEASLAKRYGMSQKDQPWCAGMPALNSQP